MLLQQVWRESVRRRCRSPTQRPSPASASRRRRPAPARRRPPQSRRPRRARPASSLRLPEAPRKVCNLPGTPGILLLLPILALGFPISDLTPLPPKMLLSCIRLLLLSVLLGISKSLHLKRCTEDAASIQTHMSKSCATSRAGASHRDNDADSSRSSVVEAGRELRDRLSLSSPRVSCFSSPHSIICCWLCLYSLWRIQASSMLPLSICDSLLRLSTSQFHATWTGPFLACYRSRLGLLAV